MNIRSDGLWKVVKNRSYGHERRNGTEQWPTNELALGEGGWMDGKGGGFTTDSSFAPTPASDWSVFFHGKGRETHRRLLTTRPSTCITRLIMEK